MEDIFEFDDDDDDDDDNDDDNDDDDEVVNTRDDSDEYTEEYVPTSTKRVPGERAITRSVEEK